MSISRQNLTVVIVSFMSENVIHDCIQSIPEDIKIIVVDNSNNYLFKETIEKKYANTISDLEAQHSIYWLNYTKGRAYFCLKDFENAKKYLSLNRWVRVPFVISLKTCWMLLMISLCHHSKISF